MQAKMLPCPRCGTMLQEQDALAVKSGTQKCPKKNRRESGITTRGQREAYSGVSRVSGADEAWILNSIMAYSNSI